MEIRELGPADADFLGEMLYEALFWTPAKERLPREFVLAHPEVTRYHEGWGRPGDLALRRARAGDGVARISLSVDEEKPARRLYARLGYVDYQPGDGGRMLLEL